MIQNKEQIIEYDPLLRPKKPTREAMKIGSLCGLLALVSTGCPESPSIDTVSQLVTSSSLFGIGAILGYYFTKAHNKLFENEYQAYSKIVYKSKS